MRGGSEHLSWTEVQGEGHIDVCFAIRDSRVRSFRSAQPIDFAISTLGQDPGIKLLSDLPWTLPSEVPVGSSVALMCERTSTGQMMPEWRVSP